MESDEQIVFDLDGTLYDTLTHDIDIENQIRRNMGLPYLVKEDYTSNFQSADWEKFCVSIGYPQNLAGEVVRLFCELKAVSPIPEIIPGAIQAIERAERAVGEKNVHIITNETFNLVRLRFARDGLERLLPRVVTPRDNKTHSLYELSRKTTRKVSYIGDIVSDGEAVKQARDMGLENIFFYGITHKYSFNDSANMRAFINSNPTFARELGSLDEVSLVWTK